MKNILALVWLTAALAIRSLVCTAQSPDASLSFGIVTDVHYADIPDNEQRTYSQSLVKLAECVDTMNRYGVDFLVELGDFKDMPATASEERTLIFLHRAEKVFASFRGPIFHVFGNHDADCISKEQFLSVATNSGIPKEKTYYSFDRKGFHFVVLDADFDSAGRSFSRGRFGWGDSNIPDHELTWLKKDLRKAHGTTVVFIHQQLDGEGPDYVNNAEAVRKVLERSGKVAAVFQGHYHKGKYNFLNGIHYYTLKALIGGNSPENNSYAIVTLSKEQISVKGFRKASSMIFNSIQ